MISTILARSGGPPRVVAWYGRRHELDEIAGREGPRTGAGAPPAGVTRPIRVCHVLSGATGGGWMVDQLRELRRRHGYDVQAVVGAGEGPLVDLLRSEGIPYHAAAFVQSLDRPLAAFRAIRDLARYFRAQRFDVVQSHIFWTTLTVRPAAWIAGVPVRIARAGGPFHLEARPSRWLDGATTWMESALIACCETIQDAYRSMGVPDPAVALVYSGVDTRKFDAANTPAAGIRAEYGWPEDTPVVALVSYFYTRLPAAWSTPEPLYDLGLKGQEDFVLAASLILREQPSARFLLIGGPFDEYGAAYMEDVRALVRALRLDEHVIFTGHRRDINRILRDVDVAVQASLSEGCGGTIQGLLMEAPMVVTRVGGMVDTVRDGDTGVVVEPDNPRDLTRGILELLQHPERARTLGRNGRRFMLERFSLDRTIADLHGLYTRLLADRHHTGRRPGPIAFAWRTAVAAIVSAYCKVRVDLAARSAVRATRRASTLVSTLRREIRPGDIVPIESVVTLRITGELPENGLFLGGGWHGLERDHGQPFRWLDTGGELLVTRPRAEPGRIVLLAESGPGQRFEPLPLTLVDARGVEVDRVVVAERREVTLRLPLRPGETASFRLMAPPGVRAGADPRVMNLRVFQIRWDVAPEADSK